MRRPSNPFAGGPLGGGWGGFGGVGGIEGGMAGGQLHFQAGLGFFPSLFGLQFVSIWFLYIYVMKVALEKYPKITNLFIGKEGEIGWKSFMLYTTQKSGNRSYRVGKKNDK